MIRYLLTIVLCQSLIGGTYYVATTGSDTTGGGSVALPWRTISKAAGEVAAGDTVYVRAGTFNESVALTVSGNSSSPVTWIAAADNATIIEPGSELTKTWVTANEVAAGVWKHTTAPFAPGVLTANGKRVYQLSLLGDTSNNSGWTYAMLLDLLKPSASNTITYDNGWWSRADEYWDGVEASWMRHGDTGTLYIRFRNGDDPNSKTIRIASNSGLSLYVPASYGISVAADYNIVSGFRVRGANAGIVIQNGSDFNTVTGNLLEMGQFGIIGYHTSTCSSNTIVSNTITASLYGASDGDFGQWSGFANSTDAIVGNREWTRWRRYFWPKSYENANTPSAIEWNAKGTNNVIAWNTVRDATVGIVVGYPSVSPLQQMTTVASNSVSYQSSAALLLRSGSTGFRVFDNTVSNSNFTLRYQSLNYNVPSAMRGVVYRNLGVITNLFGIHNYIHWHASTAHVTVPAITNYHNTFTGGSQGINVANPDWVTFNGLANWSWFNNAFSAKDSLYINSTVAADADTWGIFQYNAVKDNSTGFSWFESSNIPLTSYLWELSTDGTIDKTSRLFDAGRAKVGTEPDTRTVAFNAWDVGFDEFDGAADTPPVSLAALAPQVFEGGAATAVRVTRSGTTSGALSGTLAVTGTAVAGVNYVAIPTSWTIANGQAYVDVAVTPLNDGERSGDKTITVTLVAGVGYEVAGDQVTITLRDSTPDSTVRGSPPLPGSTRPWRL